MNQPSPFTIYNASAGSGKTYTLTKQYLTHVLTAPFVGSYKNLLAITFTNKAVAEMKHRIIDTLVTIANAKNAEKAPEMLKTIAAETGIEISTLQLRTQRVLKHILHHYAQFSIETIDHFNHRLIRTFARDLKLPSNFEVSMDTPQLLAEAVDSVIGKVGSDEEITKLLVEFALQKTDEDKSWDISYDIGNTASLLLNENDANHLIQFEDFSLENFKNWRRRLLEKRNTLASNIERKASETLNIIAEAGLEATDFSGGSRAPFPKYLQKLSSGDFSVSFGLVWQTSMGEKPMYPKTKTTDHTASTIDELTPRFISVFQQTKEWVSQIWMYDNVLKNIVPLSVINLVQQEFNNLKEEYNVLPISEFNSLIHEQVKDHPAPFIYERLGDRYRHFFIDEFQDTSQLQWQNFLPLIENALSQQFEDGSTGSLLLVGDAKQAIYRWRGGLPEQFMDLYAGKNPFLGNPPKIENLSTNWRSCEEIVSFNNSFFTYLANYFGNKTHTNLYELGNAQASNPQKNGYVELNFIEPDNKEESHEQYGESVAKTIRKLQQQSTPLHDICILTRTKNSGIALSTYLMEEGIDIVSSETLLLVTSPIVNAMTNALVLAMFPENEMAKVSLLEYLHERFNIEKSKHEFLYELLNRKSSEFSDVLRNHGIEFSAEKIIEASLYEAFEYIISAFQLQNSTDPYLFAFMDFVLDYEKQPQAGKLNFLEHWEQKKGSASIPTGNTENAVQIMTIHKAKGLEFPVVLFPYADTAIYREVSPTAWLPLENETAPEALINFNKEVEHYGEIGAALYEERRNTLELDTYNLLYVAMTRPVNQLYIYTTFPKKKTVENPTNFSEAFVNYLQSSGDWVDGESTYTFGDFEKTCSITEEAKKTQNNTPITPKYIASNPEKHKLFLTNQEAVLWGTDVGQAIDFGNLLHETLQQIKTINDIEAVFETYSQRAILSSSKIETLHKTIRAITEHPEISYLFETSLAPETIFTERDIVTKEQQLIRPDRVNLFENNTIVITDYKTGGREKAHELQIESYANALEDMGYSISEKLLIYIQEGTISVNKI